YPSSIAADVPAELLVKYFHTTGDGYQVAQALREQVIFAPHNLLRDPPFTRIDLLCCRNLLIYLRPEAQQRALEHCHYALGGRGLLVLGSSETVGDAINRFDPVHQRHKIYRGMGAIPRGEPLPMPPQQQRALRPRVAAPHPPARTERMLHALLDAFCDELFELLLVIDETGDLIHLIGESGSLLRLPSGRPVSHIGKLARHELAIPLQNGVQRVLRQGESIAYHGVCIRDGENERLLNLVFRPLRVPGAGALVAVLIQGEQHAVAANSAVRSFDIAQETEQRLQDLEAELQQSRENLQATIEELETTNEELQATNEELLASNEELQSTNEELQSTNEELHTVNAEYQGKIIELTEMSNDVDNLLARTQIAKLLLDEDTSIRKFSPRIEDVFHIRDYDIGRPLAELAHRLQDCEPLEVVHSVLDREELEEYEVRNDAGQWFLMRVLPYRVAPGYNAGVVLTFVDITQSKRIHADMVASEARLRRILEFAQVGIWSLERGQEHLCCSAELCLLLGHEPDWQPRVADLVEAMDAGHRDAFAAAMAAVFEHAQAFDLHLAIRASDGQHRRLRAIGMPETEDGRVGRAWGAFLDLSQPAETKRTSDA
ncbi:MAG: PAS domain-containing protein, partial [Planctomycetota bacterium]